MVKTKDKEANLHAEHRKRLQNQIFSCNMNSMSEIQILEYLLTLSIPRIDTNPLAHKLLNEFDSLYNVVDADYNDLIKVKGIGAKTAMTLISLRKIFYYYRESKRIDDKMVLSTPNQFADFFADFLESKPSEELYIVCLNGKNELIKVEQVGTGGANSLSFSTRLISEKVLKLNSSAVILGHNHPQGEAVPSLEDCQSTQDIVEALSVLGIPVYDHIIIGKNSRFSFEQNGLLDEIKNSVKQLKRNEIASRALSKVENLLVNINKK